MKTTKIRKSTYLERDELVTVAKNLRGLGYTKTGDEVVDYIRNHDEGGYVMNLHGVNTQKMIQISEDFNLFA
jgi:hypothetical protein